MTFKIFYVLLGSKLNKMRKKFKLPVMLMLSSAILSVVLIMGCNNPDDSKNAKKEEKEKPDSGAAKMNSTHVIDSLMDSVTKIIPKPVVNP